MTQTWRGAIFATMVALGVAGGFGIRSAALGREQDRRTSASADSATQSVVRAAAAFLDSLSSEQRGKVQFAFTVQQAATAATFPRTGPPMMGGRDDASGRDDRNRGLPGFVGEKYGDAVWSNFPVSDVPRPGLKVGDLSGGQRDALMRLLQVLLSPKGYQKVLDIMGSDQALSEGGTNFASGTSFYTVGVFGTPSTTTPWMLQFGGHHLGLNVVFAKSQGVLTPTLTGAQPAVYTSNGRTVRVLAQENDKAFALLDALDETQRKQAILTYRVGDLVLGPGHDGETIAPEGLKAAAMTARQRALLVDVISEWVGIVNDSYAAPRLADITAGLAETYFAWSGPVTHEAGRNGTSYYRIQGPKLLIEFSPQGVGGDPSMHVHTIYRDPTNEYGRALIGK